MPDPPPPGLSCVMSDCNKSTNSCVFACVYLSPPLPPPPPRPSPSQSHVAPFLIAAVCILGISFLLLTTCTIILRWGFTRRRRRDLHSNRQFSTAGADDGGDFSVVDHPIWHITTVGLQQSVIDSIAAFKYKRLDDFLTQGSDCSVCLTEFEDGDDLRLLPKCCHAFHVNCIDVWLRSHKNCPVCRAPVVNEGFSGGNFSVRSERWSSRQDTPLSGLDNEGSIELGRGESSNDHHGGDDLRELPVEGIKIAEMLNKNRELRVLSDLGANYRFRNVLEEEDVLDTVKRSFSFNALAASAICEGIIKGNEGVCCSSSGGDDGAAMQERKIDIEDVDKQGSSFSGLLMFKSSSIGPSLQKGPVSVKRSLSSGGKLFSFRRTKSQASILPL